VLGIRPRRGVRVYNFVTEYVGKLGSNGALDVAVDRALLAAVECVVAASPIKFTTPIVMVC
jgi:hypothetical protein